MINESINKLSLIQEDIKNLNSNNLLTPEIICVSKTFSMEKLRPLIDHGHIHFGENKVQEAEKKWTTIKAQNSNLQLHMIGKLQSNKAKKAVRLFDYIHSLDNSKLADVLKKSEAELNRKLSYFIQVNIGDEDQKSGISSKNIKDFFLYCTNETRLNIIGALDTPSTGSALVLDKNISTLTHSQSAKLRNHSIGFIFQIFNLLPVYTVFENVEFALLLQKYS